MVLSIALLSIPIVKLVIPWYSEVPKLYNVQPSSEIYNITKNFQEVW